MTNREYEDVQPVFRLKPIGNNKCKMMHINYVKNGFMIENELIDITRYINKIHNIKNYVYKNIENNIFELFTLDNYNITIRLCRNNLLGSNLLLSDTYPVYTLSYCYEYSNFIKGVIIECAIYFKVDEEYKKKYLTQPKSYVNAEIEGEFIFKLHHEPELENYIDNIKLNLVDMFELQTQSFTISNNNDLFIENKINEINDNIDNIFSGYVLNNNISNNKYGILELLEHGINDYIHEIVCEGIKYRKNIRNKTMGLSDKQLTISKKSLNLNDIKSGKINLDNYYKD